MISYWCHMIFFQLYLNDITRRTSVMPHLTDFLSSQGISMDVTHRAMHHCNHHFLKHLGYIRTLKTWSIPRKCWHIFHISMSPISLALAWIYWLALRWLTAWPLLSWIDHDVVGSTLTWIYLNQKHVIWRITHFNNNTQSITCFTMLKNSLKQV